MLYGSVREVCRARLEETALRWAAAAKIDTIPVELDRACVGERE